MMFALNCGASEIVLPSLINCSCFFMLIVHIFIHRDCHGKCPVEWRKVIQGLMKIGAGPTLGYFKPGPISACSIKIKKKKQ